MVGLILPSNVKYAPYIKYYTNILDKIKIPYEIISWDKMGIDESVTYRFKCKADINKGGSIKNIIKFFSYFRFTKFVKNICDKKQYDKIIVFTAQQGIFLNNYLKRRYFNNFIYDIRDYSPVVGKFTKIFAQTLENSNFIVASSPFFKEWIKKEFYICYNVDFNVINQHLNDCINSKKYKEYYSITSIGSLIEYDINAKLVEGLHNYSKIKLVYVGNDTPDKILLKEKVNNEEVSNVSFYGTYKKDDVYDIYKDKCDFVNILRMNTDINKNALPNKLYEGVIAGRPIITFKHNVAVATLVEKYNLGIILNCIESEVSEQFLFNVLSTFNYVEFKKGRKEFLNDLILQQETFEDKVKRYLN
jgi:hypothetical protein